MPLILCQEIVKKIDLKMKSRKILKDGLLQAKKIGDFSTKRRGVKMVMLYFLQ